MKQGLRWIYSRYCLIIFALIFLLLVPLFWLFMQRRCWHRCSLILNHWWAVVFFKLSLIPVRQIVNNQLDHKSRYVFCANHTSFLDIPLMGLNRNLFVFVGKSSIAKVPLFGHMFKKVHITVDRKSLKGKYQTLKKAMQAVDEGKSLVMFPEGGTATDPPQLEPFKDGPFRVAIEKQIPIVPVTIPYNWIILPNHQGLMVHRRTAVVIYHQPIPTQGMTLKDLDPLKKRVAGIIRSELSKHHPHGN